MNTIVYNVNITITFIYCIFNFVEQTDEARVSRKQIKPKS